jgi:hypothetical protein
MSEKTNSYFTTICKATKNIWLRLCDNYTWFSAVAMNGDRGERQYYYRKHQRIANSTNS